MTNVSPDELLVVEGGGFFHFHWNFWQHAGCALAGAATGGGPQGVAAYLSCLALLH